MKHSFVLWCTWAVASSAFAHHGNSEYDLTTTARYEGTLLEVQWKNPHIVVRMATKTADGENITLDVEGASPSVLRTGGYTANSLVKGEKVTVLVSPSRRSPKESAYGYEFTKADGSTVPMVSARLIPKQTTDAAKTMFGTWVATADSFTRFTRSLGGWKLTDKAAEFRSKFTLAASGQVRCIPVSAPMLMTYPVVLVIERAKDQVNLKSEWFNAERTVYVDGRAHPAATQRFQQGHSTGKFEGESLVVDTANFTDQETGGIPSGAQRHLIERFSLGKDGKSLSYSYTLQDPEYLAAEVTGTAEMNYRPDLKLTSLECDQELAKRFLK